MRDTIGERIKKRRLELGLSQTELARRAGYADKSGISKIESGDRALTAEKIELFARVLDIDPGDLLPSGWDRPLRDLPLILTDEEKDLINKLRELPDADRRDLLQMIGIVFSAHLRRVEEEGSDNASLQG